MRPEQGEITRTHVISKEQWSVCPVSELHVCKQKQKIWARNFVGTEVSDGRGCSRAHHQAPLNDGHQHGVLVPVSQNFKTRRSGIWQQYLRLRSSLLPAKRLLASFGLISRAIGTPMGKRYLPHFSKTNEGTPNEGDRFWRVVNTCEISEES